MTVKNAFRDKRVRRIKSSALTRIAPRQRHYEEKVINRGIPRAEYGRNLTRVWP